MKSLLDQLPRPLYEDIARGRWLPVVGSGLSRNAKIPFGSPPPDWNGLANELVRELSDPDDNMDSVDVISAYSQEHGRPALVERVARAIRVGDALPASIHERLCRLPIDTMITTNFDTLLEQAFELVDKRCHVILDEPQLAITNPFPGPTLMKVHGDISRPERLILTEEDFDHFLIRNPLLSTVVGSLFAQRSIVLIGYSLSDPDLRQLLALIRERLGGGARAVYSLEVAPSGAKVARFLRRHVRTVVLPGDPRDPAPVLEQLFTEIFEDLGEKAQTRLIPKTHEGGLALHGAGRARACFLSAPIRSQADYYEWLGPIATDAGAPLLTYQDFVAPGESLISAVDTMLAASGCAVVEHDSAWTSAELGMAIARLGPERIFLVGGGAPASDLRNVRVHPRPRTVEEWAALGDEFQVWLTAVLGPTSQSLGDNVLDARIGRIMRISSKLENVLSRRLDDGTKSPRSVGQLILAAQKSGLVTGPTYSVLREFTELRNRVAHGREDALGDAAIESLLQRVEAEIASLLA